MNTEKIFPKAINQNNNNKISKINLIDLPVTMKTNSYNNNNNNISSNNNSNYLTLIFLSISNSYNNSCKMNRITIVTS